MMPRIFTTICKGAIIFIGSMLLLALLTHLFPPNAEGFSNPAVVVIPFFVNAISSFIYVSGAIIWKNKESKLFKYVVALNVFVNLFSIFYNV
ncbi:MAG: hypothetical protein AAF843_01415 [Bacteroidota bacterium]